MYLRPVAAGAVLQAAHHGREAANGALLHCSLSTLVGSGGRAGQGAGSASQERLRAAQSGSEQNKEAIIFWLLHCCEVWV